MKPPSLSDLGWPVKWEQATMIAWADYLARDEVTLWIGYDAEGPTLDLFVEGQPGPAIRWLTR